MGSTSTTILKPIEYGNHKEYIRVLSEITVYLLQDGCRSKASCEESSLPNKAEYASQEGSAFLATEATFLSSLVWFDHTFGSLREV